MDLSEYAIPMDIEKYQKPGTLTTYKVKGFLWIHERGKYLRLQASGGKEVLVDHDLLSLQTPANIDVGTLLRIERFKRPLKHHAGRIEWLVKSVETFV